MQGVGAESSTRASAAWLQPNTALPTPIQPRDSLPQWTAEAAPSRLAPQVANMRGPAPKPRSDHCTCYSRGKLILSGGRGWSQGKTHNGFFDDIHVLNIKVGGTPTPLAYCHATCRA